VIPDEAVEAAAEVLFRRSLDISGNGSLREDARAALEAAAPRMLSHEREQTRLAHIDAMVNRETKREELAAAWDEGGRAAIEREHAYGREEKAKFSNPYRKAPDA